MARITLADRLTTLANDDKRSDVSPITTATVRSASAATDLRSFSYAIRLPASQHVGAPSPATAALASEATTSATGAVAAC